MTSNSSDYRSRYVVIEVTGMANQTISRVSNYQVKVPFSQMSAAIRNISCQGGKVAKVTMQEPPSFEAVKPASAVKSTASQPAEANKETKAVRATKTVASKKKAPRKKTTTSRSSSRKSSTRTRKK